MYYNKANDTYINDMESFTIGEGTSIVYYPAGWLQTATAEEIAALGLVKVTSTGVRKDDKYYDNAETITEDKCTINSTAKNVELCKVDAIADAKSKASTILSETDWKVVRSYETGVALDKELTEYRASVRDACSKLVAEIEECTEIEQLIYIINNFVWP